MEKITSRRFYLLLIFSFVILLNPNLNVVDLMPDFIAWFILARLFERAANSAPYFEEARSGFIKLGWVNLAKILGNLFILFVRRRDTSDNNIFALVSFSFAVIELLFLIPTARNIFLALFHLGERTSASALILPLNADPHGRSEDTKKYKGDDTEISKKRKFDISADSVKSLTVFFFICKAAISTIPDMFLLTRITDKGHIVSISKFYPYVLVISQLVGLLIGIVWFMRVKKYSFNVYIQGSFDSALESMQNETGKERYEKRTKLRSILSLLTFVSVISLFTPELSMSDWDNINLLPHFIHGVLMLVAYHLIRRHAQVTKAGYVSGALYTVLAIAAYVFTVIFASEYGYADLLDTPSAVRLYLFVELSAVLEFIALAVFLVTFTKALNRMTLSHTGVPVDSDRYSLMEKEYHSALIRRNYVLMSIAILLGAVKCLDTFLSGDVQIIFSDITDVTMPIMTAPAIPWFNIVVTACAVLYIGFSFYHLSTLKEEIKMKYSQ